MRPPTRIVLILVSVDVQALWSSPRYLPLLPLALAGLALGLWPHIGSPFAPMLAVLLFGVEPAFANILFRGERDFEATALLPVEWEDVVTARNLSTAVGSSGVFALMVLMVIYAAPQPPDSAETLQAFLWWGTMLFPLLHIGNELSVRGPRRTCGWTFEDVAEAGVFLSIGAVVAVVHPLLSALSGSSVPSLVVLVISAAYWRLRSVPETAGRIRTALSTLTLTP